MLINTNPVEVQFGHSLNSAVPDNENLPDMSPGFSTFRTGVLSIMICPVIVSERA